MTHTGSVTDTGGTGVLITNNTGGTTNLLGDYTLNTGASDRLDLGTLRLDSRERLFCRSELFGEVLFSDAARFSLLRNVNEACDEVCVAGEWRPLRWPAPAP